MLKQPITYEDFNGNEVTEDVYFNIATSELVELDSNYEDGFKETLERIIASNNQKELIAEFKKIILFAYGVKSDDGKRFMKSEEARLDFSQTAAYQTLFMDLAQDDDAAAKFIVGVLPKNLTENLQAEAGDANAQALVRAAVEQSSGQAPTQSDIEAAKKIIEASSTQQMPPPPGS